MPDTPAVAPSTRERLDEFHRYATSRLDGLVKGQPVPTVAELFEEWRSRPQTPDELAASVAAVNEAIAEMEAGDTGRPTEDVIADLRAFVGARRRA